MTLQEKLNSINSNKVKKLKSGAADTIEEFWDTFIVGLLPEKEVVLQWHTILMEYVKRENTMFAIRGYNTFPRDRYDELRRGFLTKTQEQYSFFYTDNFYAAYYLKMAMDGYVPTVDEMVELHNARQFPARFGIDTANERALMAMPKGKDPGIQTAGYKIAHIINVGKDYCVDGSNVTLSEIRDNYFPGGDRIDWKRITDNTGTYYLREFKVDPKAKKFIAAEFLRFVHPFNYFLTPKKKCAYSSVFKDVAGYQPLVDFVRDKYREIYGEAYDEFLELIMVDQDSWQSSTGKESLDLKYGLDVGFSNDKMFIPATDSINTSKKEIPKELELAIVKEYLTNPKTSFRKLEKEFLGLKSPARGGGFKAKEIVNAYGVTVHEKGIFEHVDINDIIKIADGRY